MAVASLLDVTKSESYGKEECGARAEKKWQGELLEIS
jgi:hypothetical protein